VKEFIDNNANMHETGSEKTKELTENIKHTIDMTMRRQ